MKKVIFTLAAIVAATSVPALADEQLAKSNGCMGCHMIERKVVGPSYKDIAQRYANSLAKNKAKTINDLAEKIKKGGSGVWGNLPMPPYPKLSDEDARKLAEWVLNIK